MSICGAGRSLAPPVIHRPFVRGAEPASHEMVRSVIANRNDGRLHGHRRAGKNNAIGITRGAIDTFAACRRAVVYSARGGSLSRAGVLSWGTNAIDNRNPLERPHPASETVVPEFVQSGMRCKANSASLRSPPDPTKGARLAPSHCYAGGKLCHRPPGAKGRQPSSALAAR